jgi:hypothetical protein
MSEAKAMTAAARDSPAIEGLRSLEVRWILPGQVGTAIAGWFGRFPAEVATREDSYLLDPALPRLSVKFRAGRALEVKVYHGSPGILHEAGRAQGRTEYWQKWSFPVGLSGPESGGPAGWTVVRKSRRISRFSLVGERVVSGIPQSATDAACAVELTDVNTGGEAWWSLGFEATGPATLLRGTLESTVAVVFAQAPPSEVEFCMSQCQSYAEWLFRRREQGTTG